MFFDDVKTTSNKLNYKIKFFWDPLHNNVKNKNKKVKIHLEYV